MSLSRRSFVGRVGHVSAFTAGALALGGRGAEAAAGFGAIDLEMHRQQVGVVADAQVGHDAAADVQLPAGGGGAAAALARLCPQVVQNAAALGTVAPQLEHAMVSLTRTGLPRRPGR